MEVEQNMENPARNRLWMSDLTTAPYIQIRDWKIRWAAM